MANLPIDPDTKDWIDSRAGWLLDQFGREHVLSCTIVTPITDVLPPQLRPTEEDARMLLDRLCKHMLLDSARHKQIALRLGCGSIAALVLFGLLLEWLRSH